MVDIEQLMPMLTYDGDNTNVTDNTYDDINYELINRVTKSLHKSVHQFSNDNYIINYNILLAL